MVSSQRISRSQLNNMYYIPSHHATSIIYHHVACIIYHHVLYTITQQVLYTITQHTTYHRVSTLTGPGSLQVAATILGGIFTKTLKIISFHRQITSFLPSNHQLTPLQGSKSPAYTITRRCTAFTQESLHAGSLPLWSPMSMVWKRREARARRTY